MAAKLGRFRLPQVMELNDKLNKPGWIWKFHSYSNALELLLVKKGVCYMVVNDACLRFMANDCIVVLPGVLHNFFMKQNASCYTLNLILDIRTADRPDNEVQKAIDVFSGRSRRARRHASASSTTPSSRKTCSRWSATCGRTTPTIPPSRISS